MKKEIPILSGYTKAHLGGSTWSLSRETTEGDVQGLIEGNFPIVATYRKDEPLRNREAVWIAEAVRIAETVWIAEGHLMFKRYAHDFL